MSHFYGGIQGQAGEATRMGSQASGIDGYVQSHQSRISSSMEHRGGKDVAYIRIGGGHSNYSAGTLVLSFPNIDDVVNAVSKGDKKIGKILDRLHAELAKLNDEAPAALKRIERRERIERNRKQREWEAKQKRLKELNDTITDEERMNYMVMVRGLETEEHRQMYFREPREERVNESILSGYGNVEPYRNEDGNLILYSGDGFNYHIWDLTRGVELDPSVVSSAGPA